VKSNDINAKPEESIHSAIAHYHHRDQSIIP